MSLLSVVRWRNSRLHLRVFLALLTPPFGRVSGMTHASVWHSSRLRLGVCLALLMPPSGMTHAFVAASVSPISQDKLKPLVPYHFCHQWACLQTLGHEGHTQPY